MDKLKKPKMYNVPKRRAREFEEAVKKNSLKQKNAPKIDFSMIKRLGSDEKK